MTSFAPPRVVIIGLDGADWSILRRLFADGAMPTLEAFVKAGVSAPLESVLPVNSIPAWTSLMTGVNPAKHGVFSFVRPSGTPFQTLVTNSTCIRFPTVCETLTGAGLRSGVVDMPSFYPPFEVDGVMLGGMGALGPLTLSHPREVATAVKEQGGYGDDVAWMEYQGRGPELVDRLVALTENRLRVAEIVLEEQPFDLFCVVFVTPDRLQHPYCRDLVEGGPGYATARRLFVAVDEVLGRLLDRIDSTRTDVLIVSDHGFRPISKLVSVNQLLTDAGLMRSKWIERAAGRALHLGLRLPDPLQKRVFKFLEQARWGSQRCLLPGSAAYSDIADTVNVNLAGRESTGRVSESEYEETRDAVAAALTAFRDPATDVAPIKHVVKREDYFHGEFAGEAPDLVLEFEDGYAYSGVVGRTLWEWPWLQGAHSQNGIIACLGPHFRRGAEASTVSIVDVAPIVLSLLGVAPPADVDGRAAEELLAALPAAGRPTPGPPERREEPRGYSEEEEARIKERLRGLGYIE